MESFLKSYAENMNIFGNIWHTMTGGFSFRFPRVNKICYKLHVQETNVLRKGALFGKTGGVVLTSPQLMKPGS